MFQSSRGSNLRLLVAEEMLSRRVNLSFIYKIVDTILHSANHIRFTMDDDISSEISLAMQSREWM